MSSVYFSQKYRSRWHTRHDGKKASVHLRAEKERKKEEKREREREMDEQITTTEINLDAGETVWAHGNLQIYFY